MFYFFLLFRTPKITAFVIISIWLTSLILMSPTIALYKVQTKNQTIYLNEHGSIVDEAVCTRWSSNENWLPRQLDTILDFTWLYLLPQILIAVCNGRISWKLWSVARSGRQRGRSSFFSIREKKRVTVILVAITVIFAIGWLPLHFLKIMVDFQIYIPNGTEIILMLCTFAANAINPIVYCSFSSQFKRYFCKEFCCCFRIKLPLRRNIALERRAPLIPSRPKPIIDIEDGCSVCLSETKQKKCAKRPTGIALMSENGIGALIAYETRKCNSLPSFQVIEVTAIYETRENNLKPENDSSNTSKQETGQTYV